MGFCARFDVSDINVADNSTFYSLDEYSNIGMKLYPNPTNSIINIELDGAIGSQLMITDVFGRIITTKIISRSKYSVPISQLSNGMYNVTITSATNQYSKTFIKQ